MARCEERRTQSVVCMLSCVAIVFNIHSLLVNKSTEVVHGVEAQNIVNLAA